MNDGMTYALVTFTIVPLVLGGYLAYLTRRTRAAQQDFVRDPGSAPTATQDGSVAGLAEPDEVATRQP